jgi:1,2-diacylglycerol 3-alpha-glucosyltransferase
MKKPKFVQIVMGVGGGCGPQISRKEDYLYNPIYVMGKKGFDSEMWTLIKPGEKKSEIRDGLQVRRFSNTFSLLMNLFLDRRVKLVHAHLRPFLPSLLAPLAFKKCVLTPHSYELGSNRLIKAASLFFMKRFDRVIALTPYERKIYLRNGLKKDKVVLMPHSIDYDFFSKNPEKKGLTIRKKYGIRKNDFLITSISNFRRFKNLDSMLAAFGVFSKKVRNTKFIVVGINQYKNPKYGEQNSLRYKSVRDPEDVIKKYNLQEKVILTGSLDYNKVREILSVSDVFVNNSDPETMGLSVYEAASAGVPLCLSDIGSFRTVFDDMALYSPPRDENALAKRYMEYYKNPKLRGKMGAKLKIYLKKWNYPIFIKKLFKFYSRVLG